LKQEVGLTKTGKCQNMTV